MNKYQLTYFIPVITIPLFMIWGVGISDSIFQCETDDLGLGEQCNNFRYLARVAMVLLDIVILLGGMIIIRSYISSDSESQSFSNVGVK